MTTRIASIVLLTVLYVSLVDSFTGWDVAFGGGLALALQTIYGRFLFGSRTRSARRPADLLGWPGLAAALTWSMFRGVWAVVLVTLGLRPGRIAGIVEVPIGDRSTTGIAASALAMNLGPDAFLLDVDHERRVMIFHVVDARDPERIRRREQGFYQHWQRRVLP
jgi:multisubunit Na+/H+ antiporter MnhE subunit